MTYEYLCTACENVWEAEQSISEPALKVCPRCHKETAKRQVSGGAGFILKGGGWYADLYGSSPKKPEGKSEKSEKSDSSSGDAKTDANAKKAEPASGDTGTKKETPKGDGGGTSSGTKGGADSSAA